MLHSEMLEKLVAFYLRLNGYFTTGLILHSTKKGRNSAQIDLLAVRHPFHDQSYRGVPCSDFLDLREGTVDFLICEVKSSDQGFNQSIQKNDVLKDALAWAGLVPPDSLNGIVDRVVPLLADGVDAEVAAKGVFEGQIRIRGLICCPQTPADKTNRWCLYQEEIIEFCVKCLNYKDTPSSCSRKYGFNAWGSTFCDFAEFFKKWRGQNLPTASDLWAFLEAKRKNQDKVANQNPKLAAVR